MYSGIAKLCHDSCTTGICQSTGRSAITGCNIVGFSSNFFFLCEIQFFGIIVAICDLEHDLETIYKWRVLSC